MPNLKILSKTNFHLSQTRRLLRDRSANVLESFAHCLNQEILSRSTFANFAFHFLRSIHCSDQKFTRFPTIAILSLFRCVIAAQPVIVDGEAQIKRSNKQGLFSCRRTHSRLIIINFRIEVVRRAARHDANKNFLSI